MWEPLRIAYSFTALYHDTLGLERVLWLLPSSSQRSRDRQKARQDHTGSNKQYWLKWPIKDLFLKNCFNWGGHQKNCLHSGGRITLFTSPSWWQEIMSDSGTINGLWQKRSVFRHLSLITFILLLKSLADKFFIDKHFISDESKAPSNLSAWRFQNQVLTVSFLPS